MLLGALVFAQPAAATTFCVPNFFAACPNSGGNVATSNFANAVSQNGSDGVADTVYIGEYTYTDAGSINAAGTDPLTVIGSGRDKSAITSSSSANIYVLRTNNRTGQVTMKDLAIVVPASFPDAGGEGSALQALKLNLERVDFITENTPGDSSAVANLIGGGTFDDVHIFGRNGASFDRGIDGDLCSAGTLTVINSEVVTEGTGINSKCKNRPVVVQRSEIASVSSGLSVSQGGSLEASNTIIRGGDVSPIQSYNSTGDVTTLKLDHITMLALGDNTVPALAATVSASSSATADINIQVSNSIIAGFQKTWKLEAPANQPARGNAKLSLAYSNFVPSGDLLGDSTVTMTNTLNQNPGFASITDFHLSASSPMVDAGDPNAATPTVDFDGGLRPVDGNCDDSAVRDMGAYEYVPQPGDCPILVPPPDTTAPVVSKVKFRFKAGKGGALRLRVSENAKVRIAFVPLPKGKGKRKKVVINRQAMAGPLTQKLGKRRLKPGRYRLTIVAMDAAGNISKPIVRKVKVKR